MCSTVIEVPSLLFSETWCSGSLAWIACRKKIKKLKAFSFQITFSGDEKKPAN
jgi:hypothetical protein